MTAQLLGLVLAGGRSTRMQRDKAALQYRDGQTQLAAAVAALRPFVADVFVSVRADQRDDSTRREFKQIVDQIDSAGPIAGITAAQAEHPQAAWWVLACDLPFLDAATLDHLAAQRDSSCDATAYRSSHDGLPEPLCAIYEPRSREPLAAFLAAGRQCPRKFLLQANTRLLAAPHAHALDNANTSEDYWQAMAKLNPTQADTARDIHVQYFALLREQAGRREQTLTTTARTPRELYDELRQQYPFTLSPDVLRVAVNGEFADWSRPLSTADAVVFIPPVAGG
ncbi:MAG: NTP transferase domain-containing protein [Proteobacteria bacterium]|nr:NTP transferase domain-containing protein [Pseudomonadota bacterium]